MSEILVNKLTGTSTAGSILVTGEGNSTTTNLQQGLAKAWGHFDGSAGSVSYGDSFGLSGLIDESSGRYTSTFTNAMANAFYSINCTGSTNRRGQVDTGSIATGSFTAEFTDNSDSFADPSYALLTIHGDLA